MNETTEVALVFMPYGRADRPVIGLGYLAAALQQADINAAVIHGNIAFAERLGLQKFTFLTRSSYTDLLGEWTFAGL